MPPNSNNWECIASLLTTVEMTKLKKNEDIFAILKSVWMFSDFFTELDLMMLPIPAA
jgi:hypothetical protein